MSRTAFTLAPLLAAALFAGGQAKAQDGILGDDFARDYGTIVVTGEREIGRDLFETVEIPENACLSAAPELGEDEPGFAIDASGMKRIRDLERIRRKTRAGTIFISGGDFTGQKVADAGLYDMCFFGTNFSQTDWSGFSGSGMGFVGADLTGAQLGGTQMPFVLFRNAVLAETDARGAVWTNGQLDGGWDGSVRNLDLSGADLTGFRVECGTSEIDGCATTRDGLRLTGATLRRASFYGFYWPEIDLAEAVVDQTELSLDHLGALGAARLAGPVVLRSPRRAIMLFPVEAEQLAGVELENAPSDPCAGEPAGALAVACMEPGSETRALLRSIANFESAAADSAGYAEARRKWIARRDACLETEDEEPRTACVLASYREWQAELRGSAAAPDWLTEPGYRLFLSSEAAFPTQVGNPGLYGRVLPIMLDTATAALIVRVDEKGAISARGVTETGCMFDAEGLSYDAEAGTVNLSRIVRRRSQPAEPLIALSGGDAEIVTEGLEKLAACPGDNDFTRLRPLALGDELLRDIYQRF